MVWDLPPVIKPHRDWTAPIAQRFRQTKAACNLPALGAQPYLRMNETTPCKNRSGADSSAFIDKLTYASDTFICYSIRMMRHSVAKQ